MKSKLRILAGALFLMATPGCVHDGLYDSFSQADERQNDYKDLSVAIPVNKVKFEGEVIRLAELPKEELLQLIVQDDIGTTIEKREAGGNTSGYGSNIGVKGGRYKITAVNYKYSPFENTDNADILKVGFGVRVTMNLQVLSSNVNIGSFPALAAAAERNQVTGSMKIEKVGIKSPRLIAATATAFQSLDKANIQLAGSYASDVENILNDSSTTVYPCVIGVKRMPAPTDSTP